MQQQRMLSGVGASTSACSVPANLRFSRRRRCVPLAAVAGLSPLVAAPTPIEKVVYLGRRAELGDRYIKSSPLGRGSFGFVYKGIDQRTGVEVAIKRQPTIKAPGRGDLCRSKIQEQIAKEIRVLQRLSNCDRVGQLLDYFDDGTDIFLIMELCHGVDLERVSEAAGPLSERAVRLAAYEIMHVLKACHDVGVIYGDVKPANFSLKFKGKNPLLSADPTLLQQGAWLKALDFGCSQRYGNTPLSRRTGTPVYMAPEIYSCSYGTGVDIWSTGVMLYELFTGGYYPFWRTPGCGTACKLVEMADAITNNKIAYDLPPFQSMSDEGIDFLQRCLTRTPEFRITAERALEHPWLAAITKSPVVPPSALPALPLTASGHIIPLHDVPIPTNTVTARWCDGGISSSSSANNNSNGGGGSGSVNENANVRTGVVLPMGGAANNIVPGKLLGATRVQPRRPAEVAGARQ